jgi:primosomal protein N'
MGPSDIARIFNEIITEHGSSAILKERVEFLRDQMQALMEKVKELEAKNAELEREGSDLTAQLITKTSREEFEEHRGAFFKRKPEGGYHLAVYCPSCHRAAGSIHPKMPFTCDKPGCSWVSGFKGRELDDIIKELPLRPS